MNDAEEILLKKALMFLNEEVEQPTGIEDLLSLPCYYLEEISDEDSGKLKALMNINNIRELAEVDLDQQREKIIKNGWKYSEFEKWVLSARIIARIANYDVSSGKKIALLGLENAGKTAIREVILRKYKGTNSVFQKIIQKLQPTKGIERKVISVLDNDLQLWDMGGQESYRANYLREPERFLMDIDVIIYVIDIQDSKRHNQAIEYLRQLATTFRALKQTPYFLVCYHKFDPDLQDKERYREWIQNSWKVISLILDETEYPRKMHITSIYDDVTIFKLFSDALMIVADFNVEQILNKILEKKAQEEGLNNLILIDDNALKLGEYFKDTETNLKLKDRLYQFAIQTINVINQLSELNKEMKEKKYIKSVHYSFYTNNESFVINRILLFSKSIYLAYFHPKGKELDMKFTRSLMPWLSNLFI